MNILKKLKHIFFLILLIQFSTSGFGQLKIVVLGSSTAAGAGASEPDSSWVNKYTVYLQNIDADNEVVNLAQGGFTTYHILPTGTITPPGRPEPDITKNISAALFENPDAIIINLPSNDAASAFTVTEQLGNYDLVLSMASNAQIPVWIATPQGRNLDTEGKQNLIEMRDSTFARYGDMAIDFWTYIGQSNGSLNVLYDSGDGVHLNDNGHKVLFNRVVGKDIPTYLLTPNKNITFSKISYNLFPNPANDYVLVEFKQDVVKNTKLVIRDINGKMIDTYFLENKSTKINITSLIRGAYSFTIFNEKEIWTDIVIKKNNR